MMKIAFGYERYSSLSQSETSIQVQKDAIERYCAENNIKLVAHYSDYAISGQEAENRPRFMRMISDLSGGAIDYIIVYTRDRFSRSMKDFVKYIGIMSEYACDFRCVNGEGEDNASGCEDFVSRKGRIPAPIHSFKN